jgi:integrase
MSVHQLKDGNWFVQYLNPDPPPRLKREYFGRGATGQARAEKRNRSTGKRAPVANEGPTILDIAGEYIETKEFNENSKNMLAIRLKANILPFFGNKQAARISHADIERYIYHRRKTVKGSTVRREIVDIKAILTWAVKRHPPLIPYNPIRDFPMPRSDDAVITPPSPQECAAILRHANQRLTRGINLAWYTGLRPGAVEMLSLTWGAVLWDRQVIRINSADKGGPALRDVPIHPVLFGMLKDWWALDGNGFGPIIHKNGLPIKSLKKAWRIAKRKAGISRRLRLYELRHDYITTALESGVDIKVLAEIVGSAPETLRKHYQHVSSLSKVKAVSDIRS